MKLTSSFNSNTTSGGIMVGDMYNNINSNADLMTTLPMGATLNQASTGNLQKYKFKKSAGEKLKSENKINHKKQ
jgi:hypothetical protein